MEKEKLLQRTFPLHELQWELKGFWPWVPLKGTSMEIGDELMGVTEWIPATVPGGVHEDLFRAGLIDNPYRDMNSLLCEWVENRWWVYRTVFECSDLEGEAFELHFKGLDYEALIYWNGICLGEHKGMFEPAVFDVTERMAEIAGKTELLVVLKHPPDEMGQIGRTSETFTQKSRFNYKWDFSTRLINIGIWDEVELVARQAVAFGETSIFSDYEDGCGTVEIEAQLKRYGHAAGDISVRAGMYDPEGMLISQDLRYGKLEEPVRFSFNIDSPQLWYPNGYGMQPLYQISLEIYDGDRVLDEKKVRTGIRKLEYMRNEGSPEDALPYTIVINGKKIYIKGANLTPLDHLYGNVAQDRYEWIIGLAKNANMNLLRIWGGGLIEKEALYKLCDRHGLLIWQEFIQSSSGVDNLPSKRSEFIELLRRNALSALKSRRNHVCLAVWSGGNELMSAPNVPSSLEDENLAMLRGLVETHDPGRLFLPTSASGPVQYITEEKGVSHDVHGHWKYQGNPRHYELYGQADHLFHSEFGVDGLSSLKSLQKFLSAEHLHPTSMRDSLVWRHHGEWWDTYDRDLQMFGTLEDLGTFSKSSQWMQAEGLRFILDANRRRKFNNSGSIIWQLNEPWPNVSCTNLVDYFLEPKMAYYWVLRAYSSDRASLVYDKLNYSPGEKTVMPVYVCSAQEGTKQAVTAWVVDSAGAVYHKQNFEGTVEKDKALFLGNLEFEVPVTNDGLFYVRLESETDGEVSGSGSDCYFFSTFDGSLYAPALELTGASLEVTADSSWTDIREGETAESGMMQRAYTVRNAGRNVALHVFPEEQSDKFWMIASDAYFTLFPGEERTINIICRRKTGGLFNDREVEQSEKETPEIGFETYDA